MGTASPEGLRERTRRAVREELMATAMDLFAARGYAETTVSEIAATAGISERSFFRYFASKEDVVLSSLDRLGEALVDRLAHLPPDLPAWPALRATFTVVADLYDGNPQRYLAILGLREDTPALTAHYLERRARWQDQMVPHLIPRLPDWPPRTGSGDTGDSGESALPDPCPHAVAGAALACFGAAETAWVNRGAVTPLADLLDLTMGALRPLDGDG